MIISIFNDIRIIFMIIRVLLSKYNIKDFMSANSVKTYRINLPRI